MTDRERIERALALINDVIPADSEWLPLFPGSGELDAGGPWWWSILREIRQQLIADPVTIDGLRHSTPRPFDQDKD